MLLSYSVYIIEGSSSWIMGKVKFFNCTSLKKKLMKSFYDNSESPVAIGFFHKAFFYLEMSSLLCRLPALAEATDRDHYPSSCVVVGVTKKILSYFSREPQRPAS